MKSWITAVCALVLGIMIGFMIGLRRPTEIHMAFSDVGDLFVNPKQGDVIKWYNNGNPLSVKFKGPSPCNNPNGPAAGTCTIREPKGVYFYDCTGCEDPGIGMGSDVIMDQAAVTHAGILPPPYATPKNPQIYCDSGTVKVNKPISAKAGDSFQFLPNGNLTFTVAFAANTCTQGDLLKNGASDCTLMAGATNQPAYPITITGCGTGNGTGSLTVP